MSFVHDDPDFVQVLRFVADETRIDPSLVEKDYWVTHCMWALHQTGLELWFKGGTSLSKGYCVIQRFSEDLDLMVQHGTVAGLPAVPNWTSVNKGPIAARRAFYEALPGAFVIPSVKVEIDEKAQDKYARGINLVGLRITTFFAGEHEVRVLDPSRVELLAAIGCEVTVDG